MIETVVAWSLCFFARIVVAAFLGNTTLRVAAGLFVADDDASDFPWCWLGLSLVVGGPLLAAVTILFPGSTPSTKADVFWQLAAALAAFCLGLVLVPVGFAVACVRMILP